MLRVMLRILVSYSGRTRRTRSTSHSLVPGSNKSKTESVALASVGGPIGLSCLLRLSHGSSQTLIHWPSPTIQPKFFIRSSRPARMLLQPWEIEYDVPTIKKSLSG